MALFDLLDCVGVVIAISLVNDTVFRWCFDYTTYDVTGMSPQSRTLAQLLKGFVSSGTLYPPLKRTLREPFAVEKLVSV